ncbi:hypothetical protein HBE96_17235 [Clostridium sp. P21]|uniref:Uncharacterized protein n=1 Tax=Clostridium muellerianum TaxID=2716538 RepID=A0A7Y0HQP2_9CLOT|nr:hypothetical protein [Clostridium muellerianum]NMM64366.1 hypothetical protein [Clostridium muellerianum]
MIGNLAKRKCKIFDATQTVEINKYQIRLIYELIRIHGMSCGADLASEYIYDKDIDIEEITNELREYLNKGFKEDIKKIVKEMQKVLGISNKFFVCDINKSIINIFDLTYDEFLNKQGFITEDFAKVILTI